MTPLKTAVIPAEGIGRKVIPEEIDALETAGCEQGLHSTAPNSIGPVGPITQRGEGYPRTGSNNCGTSRPSASIMVPSALRLSLAGIACSMIVVIFVHLS